MAIIKGISHLAFDVADMEKSLHFYCDILGFQDLFEMADDEGNPWIRYLKVTEGSFIELFYNRKGENSRGSYSHLCLEVEDIFAAAAHMRENGVKLDAEPCQGKDTNWQCWIHDPDGNRIELMQYSPNCPQKTK